MEQKKLEIEYNNQTYEKELFSNYKELVNEIDKEFKIPTYKIYDNKEKEITEENYQNFIKNNNKPKIIIKERFAETKYPENNIIISGMDENVKKKEKKTEVFFLDDSNIENSSKQNIKINEKKNDNEKQSKEKKENKDNENKNRDKEKELYDKIQNLENENKQLKEKIKSLKNENNELKEKLLNEKKIENLNNTLKDHLENEIEQFKENFINEILKYNKKILIKEIKSNNQLIHKKYKCENCKELIIEIRYKCNKCLNYNLCEKCYNDLKKNKLLHEHEYKNFSEKDTIKHSDNISNSQSKNNNINNTHHQKSSSVEKNSQNIIIQNNNDYSYTTKGNQIIKKTVKVGEKSLVIHITIKNNGRYIYDEDSKLVCDPKSEIKCDSVKIKPLKPNEEEIVYVFFNDLDKYEKGHEYSTYLNLKVGNKIIGKEIQIKLIILMEDSEYLKRFREDFNLGNNYSDSKLLKYLKNFDYNFNKAFQAFVNNNNNN